MRKKTQSWQEMDKKHLSLATLVEEYLTTCRLEGKTPKTINGYREKLSRFVRTRGGTLADFTLPAVRAYIAEFQAKKRYSDHPTMPTYEEHVSAMTIRNHVRVLKAFASWLQREDYLPDNPLERLKAPKAPRKVMQTLTPEEICRLLGCLNVNTQGGCRDAAILSLFLDTGLRCAELIGLRVADLHLEDGWLKVMGKGQKERIVPFGAKATRLLQRYVLHFRPKGGDGEHVFLSWAAEPISESAVASVFRRLAEKADVPRLHVHLLRHTFATTYLIGGGDSLTLQRILGHETLEMTRRYVDFVASQVVVTRRRLSPLDTLNSAASRRNGSK